MTRHDTMPPWPILWVRQHIKSRTLAQRARKESTMPSEHVDAGWGRSAPTFAYTLENLKRIGKGRGAPAPAGIDVLRGHRGLLSRSLSQCSALDVLPHPQDRPWGHCIVPCHGRILVPYSLRIALWQAGSSKEHAWHAYVIWSEQTWLPNISPCTT